MLREYHAKYCRLFVFPGTSAENSARAIIDSTAPFDVTGAITSNGPTHFKNESIGQVSNGFKVPHYFTSPDTPWIKVAIERLEKDPLCVFWAGTL